MWFRLLATVSFIPGPCVLAHKWSHDPARMIKVFSRNFVRSVRKVNSPFLETTGFKTHISFKLLTTVFSRSRKPV